MKKEKIIQIAYDSENRNPLILTNEGRVLRVVPKRTPSGKFQSSWTLVGDAWKEVQVEIDNVSYVWEDVTPNLELIKKN